MCPAFDLNECRRQRCLFFFVIGGADAPRVLCCAAQLRSSFKSRMPECQSGDAGAIPADRTNFQHTAGARCAAESPKLCLLGAAPRRRANFRMRGGQMGRQRPHKPLIERVRFPPPLNYSTGLLDHSGGRPLCKRESTVQSRGGPPFSKSNPGVGSRVKTAGRL